MLHADQWTPSKFAKRGGRWRASTDRREVGVGSRLHADRVVALYERHLPGYARGALIDLGCGKVPLYGLYGPLVDRVTCVDWSRSAHGSRHLDLEADLSRPLPLPNAGFDTVILSDALEHVAEPRHLWAEMGRLLRPGGCVLMNVPFLYGLHEVPDDHGRYTSFALRRMAGEAGFEVELLEAVGGSLHVLADLLAKHVAHVPAVGGMLALLLQGAVGALDRLRWGQRFAALSAERFPLGYFLVARRR